jgi:CRP/FNR family cyclic AMP-dependent transcriptional regulator
MTLKSRFEALPDLIDALSQQKIIFGNIELAKLIATEGELIEFLPGRNIIEQGASDRDIYFLLAGRAQIIINGIRLYPRTAGWSVGEMSAINRNISRAATIEALEPTVTWKISHNRLAAVGSEMPDLWRLLALDLTGRLEQRNQFISRVNTKPNLFIICSREALQIAKTIRVGLEHDAEVEIWSDEKIFPPGGYPIEALEKQVNEADFGIALAEPDDLILSRDRTTYTPRDNVIFELGFFMSRLGRFRTLLLVPRDEEVKLPSDFKGLTPISYNKGTSPTDQAKMMGPTIDKISNLIAELGVRSSLVEKK